MWQGLDLDPGFISPMLLISKACTHVNWINNIAVRIRGVSRTD